MKYISLNGENFNINSLDKFRRRQQVTECWRAENGVYALKRVTYTEDWSLSELRAMALKIIKSLERGCKAYGAVDGGEIIGFALLDNKLFGTNYKYADLAEFYVSEQYRRMGVGRNLFKLAADGAKKSGAEKLYISAHSAKEVIAAYMSYGCKFACEINAELAQKEPCDLQLEYEL